MFVVVLSGKGLWDETRRDETITRSDESSWLCVYLRDLETSKMRLLMSQLGCRAIEKLVSRKIWYFFTVASLIVFSNCFALLLVLLLHFLMRWRLITIITQLKLLRGMQTSRNTNWCGKHPHFRPSSHSLRNSILWWNDPGTAPLSSKSRHIRQKPGNLLVLFRLPCL